MSYVVASGGSKYIQIELANGVSVKFKAKIAHMGEKYIISIPSAYHDNVDKRNWQGKYVNVDLAEDEE